MALSRLQLLRLPLPAVAPLFLSKTPVVLSSIRSLRSSRRLLCSISPPPPSPPPQDSVAGEKPTSIVGDLLDYLNESWTQFHATAEAKRQLIAAGFQLLNENDEWNLQPGGRYLFTRNMSCLIAFPVSETEWPGLVRPANFTYPFVLMACGDGHGDSALIETGKKIHGEIMVSGYASDVFFCNALLSMYPKFGDMGVARMVFDKMHVRDLISLNIVISGYARNSQPGRALFEFSVVVKNGFKPDRATFLGMLPACADLSVSVVAKNGFKPDRATILGMLPACADLSALKQGKEIHACMIRCCILLDEFLVNALIDGYAKSGFIAPLMAFSIPDEIHPL